MALEVLKNVDEIGGFKVKRIDWERKSGNEDFHIDISDKANAITFYIQNGPIKEVGVNGCQVDTLIEAAAKIISGLNEKFPCEENRNAFLCLKDALRWLQTRTERRTRQGIEGKSEERSG